LEEKESYYIQIIHNSVSYGGQDYNQSAWLTCRIIDYEVQLM